MLEWICSMYLIIMFSSSMRMWDAYLFGKAVEPVITWKYFWSLNTIWLIAIAVTVLANLIFVFVSWPILVAVCILMILFYNLTDILLRKLQKKD